MMEAGPQTYSIRPKAVALFGTGMALTLRASVGAARLEAYREGLF